MLLAMMISGKSLDQKQLATALSNKAAPPPPPTRKRKTRSTSKGGGSKKTTKVYNLVSGDIMQTNQKVEDAENDEDVATSQPELVSILLITNV